MHPMAQESTEVTVDRWRTGEAESPAGPLFTAGKFAEADIAAPGRALTRLSCFARTICTAQGSACC